ncbi:MAG TPA: transcriptional regulator [Bryobacteraceae bacterium]|nr:transcriptional regulator [Bryobacteraceae bacterium]
MAKNNALASHRAPAARPIAAKSGPIPDLDRLIHPRMRLGIISALAAADAPLTFNDLKNLLQTTDGNLSVHARKLEEAKYIACTKSFEGRMPKTEYTLTAAGRKAFDKYLDHMEAILEASKR